MIIAIAVWLCAHVGVVSAPPVIINAIAVGSIVENSSSYYAGQSSIDKDR